jgi:hypothetical protein
LRQHATVQMTQVQSHPFLLLPSPHSANYEGQSKSSRNSLTSPVWCTTSSYRLNGVLLVMSTCEFRSRWGMLFGGNDERSGRDSGFCVAIAHRVAYCLLCSNSSQRKPFLSSPSHRTVRIVLRVNFCLFPTRKMGLKGPRFATMEDIKSNTTARLPPVLPTIAESVEQVCVCVCVRACVRVCSRIPRCLENWLTDGSNVIGFKHRPRSTPQKHFYASGTFFC